MKFLVCALFHGDHPALALRYASTLRRLRDTGRLDIRVGLNESFVACKALIRSALPGVETFVAEPQIYKYPMMRRLVHSYTGDASHLMWFDDDSCLLPDMPIGPWLDEVSARSAATRGSLGSAYRFEMTPAHRAWVKQQPWYAGRDIPAETEFNVGGWFTAPLPLLRRFDWPPPGLRHNGGDVALGARCTSRACRSPGFATASSSMQMKACGSPRLRGVVFPRNPCHPEETACNKMDECAWASAAGLTSPGAPTSIPRAWRTARNWTTRAGT